MFDAIACQECSEFICCELGAIIANKLFWQAVCSDQLISSSIVMVVLVVVIGTTSGNLESASITIRKIAPN